MIFDRDLEDAPYEQEILADSKLPLITLHTMRNTQSFKYPSNPQLSDSFSDPLEMSMDRDIYLNNAQLIKEAAVQYLKSCLKDFNHDEKIFHQSSIFPFQSFTPPANHEENAVHSLIHANHLLTEPQKKELLKNFQEFDEFLGVFNELKDQFGRQICQELIYIIANLLEVKMKFFRSLINKQNDTFLPKIERFWGYENEEQLFKGSWQVYEEVDYEQIKKFGSLGAEDIAMKIYFSGKLKYLTLREIKGDLKEGVSVADKFATLIIHLSRNIFFSLAGMAQRTEEVFEIANQLSFNYIEETDTITETLTKKIKSDE